MNVLFVGVRRDEDEIISGPQKVSNFLFNNLVKKYDGLFYYGIYEDEIPENPHKLYVINSREIKGPSSKIFNFIKSKKIDVVYFARYHSLLALYLVLLKFIFRFKLVYTVHGIVKKESKINKSFKPYHALFEYMLLKNCDRIVVVSDILKEELMAYYPNLNADKIEVINNGVSIIPIKNHIDIKEKYGLSKDKKIIFTVGTRKIKNIEHLIDNFINDDALYKMSYLLIAGEIDTEYAKYLMDKYAGYDNIRFIGVVDPDMINNIFSQSDLYIQISKFETFGMAIVEALLHKKKVIISSKLPIAEYFDEDEVYLYDEDRDNLGKMIISCLENDDDINEKGYRKASDLFSWDKISEEYYKVFKKVLFK